MTPRGKKHLLKPLVFLIAAIALEGCISPTADSVTGRYTAPIGGSPVISNETPYSAALRCMAGYTAQRPIRIAVGQIADYTGKSESDNSGRKITQGAALMAMSALSKAGVQLVERFDTSVAEMELKYANNRLIGADQNGGPDYRQIIAGSIPGSDYYLVGGITELNFNIRSEGASADGGETATNGIKGSTGGNMYVMNVGLDLRMVDTKTLQVVDVISYQKQIIGRQVSVGVFDFLGANFFDASVGESALEPIQLAVRSVIERAVLEMTARLYHTGGACTAATDPLAGPDDRHTPAPSGNPAYTPVTARNEDNSHDVTPRQDPYRYYGSSDPVGSPGLRGSE
ncbi:MAG: holdfast anchoring protein HfaB [Proteobacteria bacterium]|nr:holdfast anchoring protein HfaB [Pseudomonadota bacterium]